MGTRTARYGAGAAVMVLLALGIVVAANAISLRHSVRWDFTENKRNSVSPQTIQVLRTLKAPVSAIAFFRSDTPGKKTAEDLLTQYATYSRGKFTWRLEDTDRAPALARQYGVESYGTVVLEGGPAGQTRTEKVQDAEEEKLTNAIVKITRADKRVVYVLKGHGEREIGSTDRTRRSPTTRPSWWCRARRRISSRRSWPPSTATSPGRARSSSWPRPSRPRRP